MTRDSSILKRLDQLGMVVTKYVNGIGVFFLFVLMMITTADVFSRFLFNFPLTGSIELTEIALLLTVFCGIPYAAARGQHIYIDFVTVKLGEAWKDRFRCLADLITLVLFVLLIWQSIEYMSLMKLMNRTTSVLQLPIYPFVLVVTFGSFLFSLILIVKLLLAFASGVKSKGQLVTWLIVGAVVLYLIYFFAVTAHGLSFKFSPLMAGVLGLVILVLVFVTGVPVMSSLMLVGFLGMAYLRGAMPSLSIIGSSPYDTASNYTLSVVPLFVLMGEFCFFSGIGGDLYNMAYRWAGHLRGGLAMGTIVACGGFAAVCGDSMATAVTMGTVAFPEMKKYHYDQSLAVGCVAAGGTLGVLIPPSLAFILYAILTNQSIASLFIAGILPGILLITLFILTIYIQTRINPSLGPAGPKFPWKARFASLRSVWATLALFALVIGGMYLGVFTPTEGGGIGAFGAMMIGIVRKRLNLKGVINSLLEAGKISAVCMSILVGANIFGYFLAASKLPMELAGFVAGLAVPRLIVLILILVIYLFLGCLMPAIPMLVLTVPIFFPVITTLGYDPVWYGVLMVLMFEMAVITPPMGINVLAMQAIVKDVDLGMMFVGTVKFLLAMVVCIAILIAFPIISLFLPSLFGQPTIGFGYCRNTTLFSKEQNMPPVVNLEKCKPCGICADICPTDVFLKGPKKDQPVVRYPEECWHCNSCVLDCPQSAIALRIPLPAMMLHVEAPKPGK